MANWISSKLKVAETFFEQIDQQAAESLKKNERPRSNEEKTDAATIKVGGGSLSLKDQLKKKTRELDNNSIEYQGKLSFDPDPDPDSDPVFRNNNNNINLNNVGSSDNGGKLGIIIPDFPKSSPKPKPTLTDSDWTELLSSPNETVKKDGVSGMRGLGKDGVRRKGGSGSNGVGLDGRRKSRKENGNNGENIKSKKGVDVSVRSKYNGKLGNEEESSSSARSSGVDLQKDGKVFETRDGESKVVDGGWVENQKTDRAKESGGHIESMGVSTEILLLEETEGHSSLNVSSEDADRGYGVKKVVKDVDDSFGSTLSGKYRSGAPLVSSVSGDLRRDSSLTSDQESDSDTDLGSSSDSESERERERRKRILEEKAAAKALEAIKEHENAVARLEGEKQSLEKILEERAKQQVQEASELQTTMMETMEAVEVEKQKHNTTRMEALALLSKLETANADLAKSLAAAQKNLEVEVNHVAGFRQRFELKDATLQELRKRISETCQTGTYLNQMGAPKGFEFEREILEAELSFLSDKFLILEEKARKLEENIEMTRKEMEEPTEVEVELKRRLGQLTDHLIQKQAQVEVLSSEKAALLLRIEAVSRLLEENKSMTDAKDVESGTWETTDSKLRPLLEDKIRSGRKHLGSLFQQLDSVFSAGAVFLRRNSTARLWSLVYLVSLHLWVIYILTSPSKSSDKSKSGAVFSLENINSTSGV